MTEAEYAHGFLKMAVALAIQNLETELPSVQVRFVGEAVPEPWPVEIAAAYRAHLEAAARSMLGSRFWIILDRENMPPELVLIGDPP